MKIPEKYLKEKNILIILIGIAVIVGIQKYLGGPTRIGNYLIFKNAFFDLINGRQMYGRMPSEYLYSPAFAVLMAPFALLPDLPGVILWCLVQSLSVYAVIRLFPDLDRNEKWFFLGIIFFEFITAQQNLQTNPSVAALIMLGFIFLKKGKPFPAALFLVFSFYIKIYGIIACVLFLFFEKKIPFILSCAFWMLVFFLLPLLVVPAGQFIDLYKSWYQFTMVLHDNASVNYSSSLNTRDPALSFMSLVHVWFGITIPSLIMQVVSMGLLLLPLIRTGRYQDELFRKLYLAFLLIYFVIFNHIAESASYIVAMCGVAVWYLNEKKNGFTITLFVLAFVLTSLSPTDLFPRYIRQEYIKPLVLKALPCILIWFWLFFRLFTLKPSTQR